MLEVRHRERIETGRAESDQLGIEEAEADGTVGLAYPDNDVTTTSRRHPAVLSFRHFEEEVLSTAPEASVTR